MRFLKALRQWLAPTGTMRERWVRSVYVPMLATGPNGMRRHLKSFGKVVPEVVVLQDLAVQEFKPQAIRRIIALKLDHIGDLILSMRALQTLRDGFPDAHITLVVASWNEALARRMTWIDRIVCFDFFTPLNRDWEATDEVLKALYDGIERLPLEPCDLAIDLRHDADTRPCLYRLEARYRAGFYAPREVGLPYLDLILPVSEAIPAPGRWSSSLHADQRLQMLAAVVVTTFAPPPPHPAMAMILPQNRLSTRRIAILAVGAGDPIRCWPVERYAELAEALIAQHRLDIVVLGGVADRANIMRLAALLPRGRVQTIVGAPLPEVTQTIAGSALCVSNGSGMSHLAAALGVPTVSILGGTTRMEVWRATGPNAISVGGRTPCQPCGLKEAKECPWNVACLTAVQVSHVLSACERLLARFDRPAKKLMQASSAPAASR
jgi:ADP-heptose:LPS heptosyltransferase